MQFALAMELPFLIVGSVLLFGLVGYFLDRWLHSSPAFLMILGFLGFFSGLREMLRRLKKVDSFKDRTNDGKGSGSTEH